jgi:integrase
MTRLQSAKADGSYVEPSKQTLGEYLMGWLAEVGTDGGIRATTWKTYDVAIRVHVAPRLGAVPLQQVSRAEIKTLYRQLRTGGRARGGPGELSPKSVHNVHLCLHRALGEAVEDGLIRANPADRAHRMPADRPEMLYWSASELLRFLDSAEDDPSFAMWRLAAYTGMRRGELLGLRWLDVDLDRQRLSVRQQMVRTGGKTEFRAPKSKAGIRPISLDRDTVEAIRSVQRVQASAKLGCGPAYRADLDLVFCRADGSPHDPDVVSHQFERQIARAGVRRIRFHDLRHTHATIALSAGIHPKVVQERLGHSSIKVTMDLYSHVIPALDEDAASRVAAAVDRSRSS